MCGLAGFARKADAPEFETAKKVFTEIMLRMGHRGRHATGMAVMCPGCEPAVFKVAAPVEKVVLSEPWRQMIDHMPLGTTRVIGHVRHASLPNAHLDEAAHPFIEGRVVGAHNGIIRNWKELAKQHEIGAHWINDSQAPLGLIDKLKSPIKAIEELEGYWALTWAQGKSVYLTRSGAPLVVAYSKAWQTMFWCSEESLIRKAYAALDLSTKGVEFWTLREDVIYKFAPGEFTEEGTNPEKAEVRTKARKGNNNTLKPSWNERVLDGQKATGSSSTALTVDTTQDDYWSHRGFNTTTGQTFDPKRRPRVKSRETMVAGVRVRDPREMKSSDLLSVTEIRELMASVLNEIDDLKGQFEVMKAENDYLWGVVRESGLLDGEDRCQNPREQDEERRLRSDVPEQLTLLEAGKCHVCGFASYPENPLLDAGNGEYVHEVCIFPTETVSTGV
jgi:hypothetical protein